MMLRKALIGLGLLATSSFASAALVVTQEPINGADMAGIVVTVTFSDMSTEMGTWQVISNMSNGNPDPILAQNGFSGGVVANTWSLTEAGTTLGGFAGPNATLPYGMFTLTNTSAILGITGFKIEGMSVGVAFDINDQLELTPGSKTGQEFVSDLMTTHSYSDQVNVAFSDLFWTLNVSLDSALMEGQRLRFFGDTDMLGEAQQVSAPASLAFVLAGLGLFSRRLSRNSVK